MTNTKARRERDLIDEVIGLKRDKAKQYGRARQDASVSSAQGVPLGGSGKKGSSDSNANNDTYLSTIGGTMMGPIAFYLASATIASGVIDISKESGNYSSRMLVIGEGASADDLEVILNASFAGQILFFQPFQAITLQSYLKTATAWASGVSYSIGDVVLYSSQRYTCYVSHTSSGSILPTDATKWHRNNIRITGADDRVVSIDEIIILQYDSTDSVWTVISGGVSSWVGTATSDLDMSNNTISDIERLDFATYAATPSTNGVLFYDGTDLKARVGGSTVNLTSGSGVGLGDNNVWTGTNEFQNTVTVEDASFGIRDQVDNTKVANFQCSGISTGTTRTYTLPDSTTSLAGLGVTTQTFTGKNLYINGTTWDSTYITDALKAANCQVKFQGDGQAHSSYSDDASQRVMEIGKYGTHEVKINAEITGSTGRTMTNPDGGADIPVPGTSEPALAIKAAMIMNTYTMYDLDTLVFSQGASSTTPAPADDWVYIEANTGTTGTPVLTGMTYNVPTSMTHQFKVNGTLKVSIDDDIDFEVGSTLEISNTIATPAALSTGAATALPSAPTAYFKVHYAGADRYIPYYT